MAGVLKSREKNNKGWARKIQKKTILQWARDIVNHFWFCSSVANTEEEFIGIWFEVVHHVVNKHIEQVRKVNASMVL